MNKEQGLTRRELLYALGGLAIGTTTIGALLKGCSETEEVEVNMYATVKTPAGTEYRLRFSQYRDAKEAAANNGQKFSEDLIPDRDKLEAHAEREWNSLVGYLEQIGYKEDRMEKMLRFVASADNSSDADTAHTDVATYIRRRLIEGTRPYRELESQNAYAKIAGLSKQETNDLENYLLGAGIIAIDPLTNVQ
jgi:hypothetical protein